MRVIRILEEAIMEAAAAATWYEKKKAGLGVEFSTALEAGLDLIEEGTLPLLPLVQANIALKEAKRLILKRFPYDIVVLEREDEVLVIAFAHHSRRLGYWQGRAVP